MTGLTAALVVEGRVPRAPALAPNGRLLCYVLAPTGRMGDHLDTALWLADVEGGGVCRRVTADSATESRARWSVDSRALYFLSDRAERGTPQLHRLGLGDGVVVAVTGWRAGIIDHLPLADPDLVALLAEDEPTERESRRVRDRDDAIVVGEREPRARLRLLDSRTGRVDTPSGFGDRHVVALRQRPDGGPLAVLTQASADVDYGPRTCRLHLFDTATGAVEDLGPVEACASSPAWWPGEDGWHLGYVALTPPLLQAGTAVFDLALSSRVRRNRTAGLPMCPTELCQTGAAPLVAYRAADGLELDGLLVSPVGESASDGPFPLVTLVHGGPYDRYADRLQLFWFPSAQWLATAGYAVFLPNPRGGQGHGHGFAARVAGRVGREEWTDTLTGIDLLIAEGVADPDRLGIAGGSHGGFMAAWAIGQTDRFRAALVSSGVTDWGMLAAIGENGQFEAALGGSTGWDGIGPHPHDALSPVPSPAASAPRCSSCTARRTPTSPSAKPCTSTGHCATSAPSTSSWSTRGKATRSGNATTNSTCCAARVPGSTAGSGPDRGCLLRRRRSRASTSERVLELCREVACRLVAQVPVER
ncbi:WD40 repeat protein [Actinokineospora auranticolor]|uniref:WD40 repeat protein n=1 Tax=Actinokineospora auranticolor TaxID=155976 RepID=A0A2S6GJY2_9PSEU|nr:WD40 repeat protein [Actinokineospora auranticolor]